MIIIFSVNLTYSQMAETPDIKMIVEFPKDAAVSHLLSFQNLDMYDIAFTSKNLKGKHYRIVSKEIWKGKIKRTDTLINSIRNPNVFKIESDTLRFNMLSGKLPDGKIKFNFRFDRYGISRKFKATKSDDYSLRTTGEDSPIFLNQPFYAFACILPYEKDGGQYWCAV